MPAFQRFVEQRFERGERYGLGLTLSFVVIAAGLWGFLTIAEDVFSQSDLYEIDFRVQEVVRTLLSEELTEWVVFITNLGGTRGTIISALILAGVLLFRRRWWALFGLVLASGGGGLVILGLKLLFQRARPVETVIEVGGYAFPSGHAFAAMVFYGYVIYLAWRLVKSVFLRIVITIPAFLMILFIGTSRVYLNVHWLTDVLGGYVSGFVWLTASIFLIHMIEHSRGP